MGRVVGPWVEYRRQLNITNQVARGDKRDGFSRNIGYVGDSTTGDDADAAVDSYLGIEKYFSKQERVDDRRRWRRCNGDDVACTLKIADVADVIDSEHCALVHMHRKVGRKEVEFPARGCLPSTVLAIDPTG